MTHNMTDLTAWRPSLQPASEREALAAQMTFCRRAAIARIEDLDDEAAASQPLPMTNLSVGGVVKHLARTEDGWFVKTFSGQQLPEPWASAPPDQPDWPFTSSRTDTVAEIIDFYEASVRRSDDVAGKHGSLDTLAAKPASRCPRGTPRRRLALIAVIGDPRVARHHSRSSVSAAIAMSSHRAMCTTLGKPSSPRPVPRLCSPFAEIHPMSAATCFQVSICARRTSSAAQ